MPIADSLIAELEHEARTTRRVLERVPADKLSWKPHRKSMSLGQLALHVATAPSDLAQWSARDEMILSGGHVTPEPASVQEILKGHDDGIPTARTILAGFDDAAMQRIWSLKDNGRELVAVPRIVMLRSFVFNHWYHHRGQLSVYLRLLDVPVPPIYGPSADENPFAAAQPAAAEA